MQWFNHASVKQPLHPSHLACQVDLLCDTPGPLCVFYCSSCGCHTLTGLQGHVSHPGAYSSRALHCQMSRAPHVQGVALGARGVAAQGLLPALVARHALHLVVDAVATAVIPISKKLPAHALAFCQGDD